MSETGECDLARILEALRQEIRETNCKIDKLIEGKVETLQVEVSTLKKGLDEFKAETRANFKEVRAEIKEIRNDVSALYK